MSHVSLKNHCASSDGGGRFRCRCRAHPAAPAPLLRGCARRPPGPSRATPTPRPPRRAHTRRHARPSHAPSSATPSGAHHATTSPRPCSRSRPQTRPPSWHLSALLPPPEHRAQHRLGVGCRERPCYPQHVPGGASQLPPLLLRPDRHLPDPLVLPVLNDVDCHQPQPIPRAGSGCVCAELPRPPLQGARSNASTLRILSRALPASPPLANLPPPLAGRSPLRLAVLAHARALACPSGGVTNALGGTGTRPPPPPPPNPPSSRPLPSPPPPPPNPPSSRPLPSQPRLHNHDGPDGSVTTACLFYLRRQIRSRW